MLENVEQVRTLIKRVERELLDREPLKMQSMKILRSIYLLNIIKDRLQRIESLLGIEKYNLVFIGQVGVGKTTAICHLLNLTRTAKKSIKISSKRSENKTRTIEYTKEILSTGSGKTTICEVVICPADTTFIEVVPAITKEVETFLKEFCEIIWQKVYPNESARLEPLSVEVLRAIRNMVDLQVTSKESKDGSKEKVTVDEAMDFAKKYSKEEFEIFKKSIFERAKLDSRVDTVLKYIPEDNVIIDNEKIWIEKNFGNLNLVKLPTFPLPGQIKIHLSSKILNFNQFPFLQSVIDTRGLDVVKDRSDIETYVREHDEAICIFTDSFSAAPNNVSEPLSRYLTKESEDVDTKVSLLVLPRKNEPEKKLGSSGTVDDREEGILQCKREIESSLEGQNIKFIHDNILFFDPLLYYTDKQCVNPEYGLELIDEEKDEVFLEFGNIVARRRAKLFADANELEDKFWKIVDGNDLSPEDERVLENIKKLLEQLKDMQILNTSVSSELISYLERQYASVLNAINRRYGEYEERNIYFEAKRIAEDTAKKNFSGPKREINGIVNLAREQASAMSGLQPIMDLIEKEINQIYEKSVVNLGDKISELLKEDKLAPQSPDNSFWCSVQGRWGAGEGFVKDVLSLYNSKIGGLSSLFEEEVLRIWEEDFMQFLMLFFGEDEE